MFEQLWKDTRHSLRVLRRNPAFTLAAVAALTLGIGANTAIFSVVNAVLLRPIALPDPDRLVFFMNTSTQGGGGGTAASPAKFAHWRAQPTVTDASAFNTGVLNYTGGSTPFQLHSARVSADFFRLLAVPMTIGRTFSAAEDLPHGEKAVVLSRAAWKGKFNADPAIVGRTLSLSGDPYVVVGVLGDFSFREIAEEPDVFVAFQLDPNSMDQGHYFRAMGRLANGVTLEQAQAQLTGSAAAYRAKIPNGLGPNGSFSVSLVREVLVRNVRPTLWVMAGAVGLVLLIACANVANLLLARATGRGREIAIRAAIGGTRGRLVRQLLTESVVLSLTGGVLGLVLGVLGMRTLLTINTADLPRVGDSGAFVDLDWRVLGFTLLVSVVTGIAFGLIPAVQASRTDLTTTLKESAGRSGSGARQQLTRSVLVVVEVALAIMLLVGAALLIRTSVALAGVDPGFDASAVLTARMSLTGPQFQTAAGVASFIHNTAERVQAVPGVELVSATCCVPLQGGYGLPFVIAGRPLEGPYHGGGGWTTVSPNYFEVFKIPVKRGRSFTDADERSGTPVVIVNEAFARQFFKDQDPLTQRLTIGKGVMREFSTESERQIVGVVGDTHSGGLDNDPQPEMFIPQGQVPDAANALNVRLSPVAWVVRTRADPHRLSTAIQDTLRQATGLPVLGAEAMGDVVSGSVSRQRFNMWLMTIFGGSALLLAAIGIYGLMAYSVSQRHQEIGIRMALGAQAESVRNMVVRQGMVLAMIGAVVGIGAAYGLARWLTASISTFLFRVQPSDPLVFVAVPVTLVLFSFVAVLVPALRASRVDPLEALRGE